jgi:hypothetical protein
VAWKRTSPSDARSRHSSASQGEFEAVELLGQLIGQGVDRAMQSGGLVDFARPGADEREADQAVGES